MTSASAPSAVETTRDRILRLADDLFARHGYARVSMRMVAAAAGVTKPALYYHFRDKDALFVECILTMQESLGDRLVEASTADLPFDERVHGVAVVLLTGTVHHPVRVHADISEHLPVEARERLGQSFEASVLRPIVELFDTARDDGGLRPGMTPAVAAAALLGIAMAFWPGSFDTYRPDAWPHSAGAPNFDAEQAATAVAGIVLRGVAAS